MEDDGVDFGEGLTSHTFGDSAKKVILHYRAMIPFVVNTAVTKAEQLTPASHSRLSMLSVSNGKGRINFVNWQSGLLPPPRS
jgi:hypothetical protein